MNSEKKLLNEEELDSVAGGAIDKLGYLIIKTPTEFKFSPDLNAETVGSSSFGRQTVWEIDTNQGLIWYRVGVNKWAAENPKNEFAMLKTFFG